MATGTEEEGEGKGRGEPSRPSSNQLLYHLNGSSHLLYFKKRTLPNSRSKVTFCGIAPSNKGIKHDFNCNSFKYNS